MAAQVLNGNAVTRAIRTDIPPKARRFPLLERWR